MTRAEANADSQLYRFSPFRFVVRYPNLVPQYKRQLQSDLDADRKHARVTIFPLTGKLFVLIWNPLEQLVSVPRSNVYTLSVSDEILFLPHDLPAPLPLGSRRSSRGPAWVRDFLAPAKPHKLYKEGAEDLRT
jgi:hypothetical protein